MPALLLVGFALLVLPVAALAQQSGPVGTPLPGSLSSGERSEVRPVDPRDVGKPWDPNLSEIDRIDASIRLRAITGKDKEDCHYGPIERRLSEDRLSRLFGEIRKRTPAEQFQALLDEPEDPSVPPRSVMIYAPYESPQPPGLSCPKGDVTAQLLEERERLVRQGQVASPPTVAPVLRANQSPPASPELEAKRLEGGPVMILSFDPGFSELQIIEAIMKSRARRGTDKLPHCYYGPGQFRIYLGTVNQYLHDHPDLPGEEYWRWFNEQTQDPKMPPVTILIRSGTLPNCAAGNLDERLGRRREQLRRSQAEQ